MLSGRGLDVSEALQLPGVVDVVVAKDIPGKKVRTFTGFDEELLAESEVDRSGFLFSHINSNCELQHKLPD